MVANKNEGLHWQNFLELLTPCLHEQSKSDPIAQNWTERWKFSYLFWTDNKNRTDFGCWCKRGVSSYQLNYDEYFWHYEFWWGALLIKWAEAVCLVRCLGHSQLVSSLSPLVNKLFGGILSWAQTLIRSFTERQLSLTLCSLCWNS